MNYLILHLEKSKTVRSIVISNIELKFLGGFMFPQATLAKWVHVAPDLQIQDAGAQYIAGIAYHELLVPEGRINVTVKTWWGNTKEYMVRFDETGLPFAACTKSQYSNTDVDLKWFKADGTFFLNEDVHDTHPTGWVDALTFNSGKTRVELVKYFLKEVENNQSEIISAREAHKVF